MPRFWLAIVLCIHVLICRVCNSFWNFIQCTWLLVSFFSWKQQPEFPSLYLRRGGGKRKKYIFLPFEKLVYKDEEWISKKPKIEHGLYRIELDSSFGQCLWPVPSRQSNVRLKCYQGLPCMPIPAVGRLHACPAPLVLQVSATPGESFWAIRANAWEVSVSLTNYTAFWTCGSACWKAVPILRWYIG